MKIRLRGFTLAEVLVVLGILVILAGLLYPVFAKAKDSAKQAVCVSNLRQIHAAMTLYRDQWGGSDSGTTASMGLPLDTDVLGRGVDSLLCPSSHLFYYHLYPSPVGIPKELFEAEDAKWAAYVQRAEQNAVLFYDPFHDANPDKKFFVHQVLAVTLSGSIAHRRGRGNMSRYEWWLD